MPLSCEIAVEAWYYSSKSTMLSKVSYHSGGRAGSSLCDNNIIKRLNKQFAKVCPIWYFVSVMQNSLQHGIRTRISLPRKRRNEYFVTGSIFVLISFFCYLFIWCFFKIFIFFWKLYKSLLTYFATAIPTNNTRKAQDFVTLITNAPQKHVS